MACLPSLAAACCGHSIMLISGCCGRSGTCPAGRTVTAYTSTTMGLPLFWGKKSLAGQNVTTDIQPHHGCTAYHGNICAQHGRRELADNMCKVWVSAAELRTAAGHRTHYSHIYTVSPAVHTHHTSSMLANLRTRAAGLQTAAAPSAASGLCSLAAGSLRCCLHSGRAPPACSSLTRQAACPCISQCYVTTNCTKPEPGPACCHNARHIMLFLQKNAACACWGDLGIPLILMAHAWA